MVACGSPVTTLTQCGGTFADPGGTANYPDGCTVTETICAGTVGQCVTLQFTAFSLENTYDYLRIYNGPTSASPLLATLTGTTIPGNITSTSGCLTLVFTSDGIISAPGWLANVICSPCGTPPPPPPGPIVASDCSGAVNICTNASFQIDPSGSGSVVEFTTGSNISNPLVNPASGNSGCMLSGELNSTWMIVNVATTGTLEFSFGADGGINCLDWIMWPYAGPTACNNIINNTLAPVRCNYNFPCESYTGIGTPLPAGGEVGNFEPELNVTCGQKFLICLSNFSSASTSVPLNFTGTASISCTTFTPITVNNATICPGTNATLTAAGGLTYSWAPGGQTTSSITVSPATTTTYTVTGNGACGSGTATATVTVLPASDPSCGCTATANNTGPYCVGGSIQLNGTGGGTYSWSGPNGFTSTLQNPTLPATAAAAGVYTLTTNLSGCVATATTTVVINPVATANANIDQTVCAGGTITLAGAVGGGATSGTWSAPTGTFSSATNLASTYTPSITTGTVTLTLTTNDPAGPCPSVLDQMIVTVNPIPTVVAGPPQTVCAGTAVTLSATGATTYSWNNGVTQGVPFTPAATATYTVTGTTSGCTNTSNVTVTVNPIPTVSAGSDVSICTGGSTTLTATGATTYSWAPGGMTTASITVSPAATTTYTVTGTSLGCTSTDAVTVSVLANAPISAGPDVSVCIGASTVLTGTGGVSYTWNNGLGNGNNFTVSPVVTTTYSVTGTNASGCVGTDAITVTVNPLPTVVAGAPQTVCAGTPVTLTATGATTYSWDNGITQGVAFTPAATTTYTVTGTTLGCTNTSSVLVTVNPLPTVVAGPAQTVCAGTPVTLTATGASTYTWNNGINQGVAFTPAATTTYTVTGTTAAGCTGTSSVAVTVNPLPIVNAGADQTVCDGSSVTLTGSGASTYTWNNGVTQGVAFTPAVGAVTYTVSGTSAAGCISTDQVLVTVNPNPLPIINGPTDYCIGNPATLSTSVLFTTFNWSTAVSTATTSATMVNNPITVTVTNAFGCTGTSPAFVVNENLVITTNSTQTICQGQSVLIHGVAQTVAGVYSQTFTIAGCDSVSNVTLVVNPLPIVNAGIDQMVCTPTATTLTATGAATYTWNNGITNGVPFNQAVGTTTYTVTGTSALGCINTDQVDITVNPLPLVNAGPDQAICIGASATIAGSGATTYTWNNGVTDNVAFTPALTNTYTVTGTDVNGCVNTDQVVVTVNPLPIVAAGPDEIICIGASVTLSGSGASTYTWDNGVTNGITFSPVTTATYTVTGTDVNGCINTDQVLVTVNPLPVVNAGPDQDVCQGTVVTLSGGGASTYSWNNGVVNGTPFTQAVGTVTYTVTGTDANGCINTDQADITVNPTPVVNAGPDQLVCIGTSVTLSGSGTATYSWNNGITNNLAFTPSVGTVTYTVTGTSVEGCVTIDDVVVTVNPLPVVFAGNDVTVCDGSTVTLTGSGASIYSWNNGVLNGTPFTPSLGATTYTVTGTSAAGCLNTDQVNVIVNPLPVVSFSPDVTSGCAPLTVNLTNTTPNSVDCLWTISNGTVLTGCGTVPVTFTQGGCYDVTLTTTSNNGCVGTLTATNLICVENDPIASFSPSSNTVATNNTEVIFTNQSIGANSYYWTFGDATQPSTDINPTHLYQDTESGNYLVTLIAYSPLGCTDTALAYINVVEELIFYVPNTFTPDDDNFNPVFQPVFTSGFDPYDFTLLIFNRWGEIVFESHDASIGWNGTYGSNGEIQMCQDGTYTWKIEFKTKLNDERKMIIGHVNLLR
jgi:gliding motility-associated-like protein